MYEDISMLHRTWFKTHNINRLGIQTVVHADHSSVRLWKYEDIFFAF